MESNQELILFKNLLMEMALRVAVLEQLLIDKNIFTIDELATVDDRLANEAKKIINEK